MRARGQTLVLFALLMLLVTLMVTITLSMGTRIKDKMELQTAADAAAYNGAVATARAFNSIAVMNRVQAAHAVSTLGTLSLISWSTLYWKHADNAAKLFRVMAVPYGINTLIQCLPPPKPLCKPCAKGFAQTLALAALSAAHASKTRRRLEDDVQLFARETEPRWRAAERIHASQLELLRRLEGYVSETGAAQQVLDAARLRAPGEVAPQRAGALASLREIDTAIFNSGGPVAGPEPHHVGHIRMGSRGHPFVRSRREHGDWGSLFSSGSLAWRSRTLLAGGIIFFSRGRGMSYYDRAWSSAPSGRIYGPLAHDGSGSRTRTAFLPASKPFKNWVKCSSPLPAFVIAEGVGLMGRGVGMSGASVSFNEHRGIGHDVQHAFRTFPPFVDFNGAQLLDSDNLHGQPKIVTTLARDIASRDDFELDVTFRFTEEAERFQMGGEGKRQLAMGSGLVYYHRKGHALEPPNLFAPYWRAGLARFTVDRPAGSGRGAWDADASDLLYEAGAPEAAEAYQQLQSVGYGGLQ